MTVPSSLRAVALLAGALVATAPLASQDASRPTRLKLADVGLPGIDLGLSPSARIDAIGGHQRRRARAALEAPYVAGRILVKFHGAAHAETVAIDPAADPEAMARLSPRAATSSSRRPTTRPRLLPSNDPLFANQWNLSALRWIRPDVNPGATSSITSPCSTPACLRQHTTSTTVSRCPSSRAATGAGRVDPVRRCTELAGRPVRPRRATSSGTTTRRSISTAGTHVAGTIVSSPTTASAWPAWLQRPAVRSGDRGDWDFIFDAPN